MNSINEFTNLITGAGEAGATYLSFIGGVLIAVTTIVIAATCFALNKRNKE